MFAFHLIRNFDELRKLGLVRSQREYARVWLGRGQHYLRDVESRGHGWQKPSPRTTAQLRANLQAVAARVPVGVGYEIMTVLSAMDRDSTVADTIRGWGR